MSHLFCLLLREICFAEKSRLVNGIFLSGGILLFVQFRCLVADEKALKEILYNKGASAFRPCPVHFEICDHKVPLTHQVGCVRMTDLNLADMAEHDDESVLQVLTELQNLHEGWQRGDVTKEQYASQCVFYGWNYHPSMLLLCRFAGRWCEHSNA